MVTVIKKKIFSRLSLVAMVVLIVLVTPSSPALAAPEELSDLAKSNIRVAIDFLRWVGSNNYADNAQAWLDAGKIKMDEDLGDNTGAETDEEGNITIRKNDVAGADLSESPRIEMFEVIAKLAALLVHEKVHAHQGPIHWTETIAYSLSISSDYDEVVAYISEILVLKRWIDWLIGEYNDEVREYNPKVKAFNVQAQAIAEGQVPDKAKMSELLDQIRQETEELITKNQGINNLIRHVPGRAKVLKKANYEKEDYLYDQMKEDWEQSLQVWIDNIRTLGRNLERGQDWAEWLKQDPPPLPEQLNTLSERLPKGAEKIIEAYRAALANREAWDRQTDSDKVQHLIPFLKQLAAFLHIVGRGNLRVYTDVTYVAYYHRVEQTLGLEVRNDEITGIALQGYDQVEVTVRVPESVILRILIADNVSAAFDQEMAAGHIRIEPEKSSINGLLLFLGALLLLTLVVLTVVLLKKK